MPPSAQPMTARDVWTAVRPSQWIKNAVVWAAFFFAYGDRTQMMSRGTSARVTAAFGLFCLVSSGIYLFNDLRDRAADRLHPLKRLRPIAAGRVPAPLAAVLAGALLAAGLLGALVLSLPFAAVVGVYVALQIMYSLGLKRVVFLDVCIIAVGFVLRAAGGGLAAGVLISPWLLLCAFLLALFLALCKRRHEKLFLEDCGRQHRPSLTHYSVRRLDQCIVGVSTAAMAAYALYTVWPDTVSRFQTGYLPLTIPFVVFGIVRYLHLAYRKESGDRPEQCLMTDLPLLFDLVLYGLTVQAIFLCRPT